MHWIQKIRKGFRLGTKSKTSPKQTGGLSHGKVADRAVIKMTDQVVERMLKLKGLS